MNPKAMIVFVLLLLGGVLAGVICGACERQYIMRNEQCAMRDY